MIKAGFALHEISSSAYGLYKAANRHEKVQKAEALISGMLKLALVVSVCCSLYTAHSIVETRTLQYALAGVTFCIQPIATLDVIGTTCFMNGIFLIRRAFILEGKIDAEAQKIFDDIIKQVRAEGFRFYDSWKKFFWYGKQRGPLETQQRISELISEIPNNYDLTQTQEWGALMATDLYAGLNSIKYATISGIGALFANAIPLSFWLDRKLVDLSKWLAPRLV